MDKKSDENGHSDIKSHVIGGIRKPMPRPEPTRSSDHAQSFWDVVMAIFKKDGLTALMLIAASYFIWTTAHENRADQKQVEVDRRADMKTAHDEFAKAMKEETDALKDINNNLVEVKTALTDHLNRDHH